MGRPSQESGEAPELKAQIVLHDATPQMTTVSLQESPEIQERFDRYVNDHWRPWSAAELPRRKTINRYNQLFALQQTISSDGADTPIELVWVSASPRGKRTDSGPRSDIH